MSEQVEENIKKKEEIVPKLPNFYFVRIRVHIRSCDVTSDQEEKSSYGLLHESNSIVDEICVRELLESDLFISNRNNFIDM